MIRPLFVCTLLGVVLPALSQPIHLPVKAGQQWGFLAVTDETATLNEDRLYDRLGDHSLPWHGKPGTASGFYLVEKNGKLGLVTAAFEEVLPPAWREIHPVSERAFLVADAAGYTVVDRDGRSLLGAQRYPAIRLPDDPALPFFLLRWEDKWGVKKRGQEEWALPPQYRELGWLDAGPDGLWKVRPDTATADSWRIVDGQGAQLPGLGGAYDQVEAAGQNHLAVQERRRASDWSIRDLAGKEVLVLSPEAELRPLNRQFFAYKEPDSRGYTVLVMRQTITPLVEKFDQLEAVDDGLVFYRRGDQGGFLAANGALLPLDTGADPAVAGAEGGCLRMTGTPEGAETPKWGLYATEAQRLVAPFRYDSIAPFTGPFARVYQNGQVGLLHETGELIAPPRFEAIPHLAAGMRAVYAYRRDSVTVFPVDAAGRPAGEGTASRVAGITGPERYEWLDYEQPGAQPDVAPAAGESQAAPDAEARYWEAVPLRPQADTLWLKEGESYWEYADGAFQLRRQEQAEITVRERASKRKKKKNSPPPPRVTKMVTRWADVGPPVKLLRRATPVDWTLAYHDYGGLAANALTVDGRNRYSARTITLLRNADQQVLDAPRMIGVRLADFAAGRSYAAFLDADGKVGLIDREGQQAVGADGQPLRFTYVGRATDGLLPACDAAAPFRATGLDRTQLLRAFNVELVDNSGNYQSERTSEGPPRWGYLDPQGQTVIPFDYEYAAPFEEGLAVNRQNGKWGAINADNEAVIPFEYDAIHADGAYWRVVKGEEAPATVYYNDGGRRFEREQDARLSVGGQALYPLQHPDGQYGYADRDGLIAIPFQYDAASPFRDGLATVRTGSKWFFIDERGREAITLDTSIIGIIEVGQFSEGLCPIRKTTILDKKATRKWGYLDTEGRLAIPARYDGAGLFKDGLAIVDSLNMADYRPGQTEGLPYERGLIDKTGRAVTACVFERIFPFNAAGFAEVIHAATGNRALIDREGQVLTGKYYEKIAALDAGMAAFAGGAWKLFNYEGEAVELPLSKVSDINYFDGKDLIVKDGAGRWQHLRLEGEAAQPVQGGFEVLQPFEDGYAFARIDQESRLYGRDGSRVRPARGESFQFWSDGLLGVRSAAGAYYATPSGYNAFDRTFETISRFAGGTALVQYRGGWGALNRNGLFVVPPVFDRISRGKGGYLIAQLPGRRYGLYGKDGRLIVPARYHAIRNLHNGLIRVEYADFVGYYRENGEALWTLEAE